MMTGHVPDQDLLLLSHHALSPWQRIRAAAHLRRCAPCQHRLNQLRQTSQLMASTIRDRSDLPWHPISPSAGMFWRMATLVFLTLLLTVGFVVWTIHHHIKPPPTHSISNPSGGCRPDLPNDRCR